MDQMWTRIGSDLIARMNGRMKFRDSRSRLFLAILVALAALASPGGPVWGSQATRPVPPPADGGWPRAYTTATGGHIVLYQPQVASWPGQKRQLSRDRAARDEGAQRVNDLGGINGGGFADRAGSYRPSGGGFGGAGGFRGGGGRRR
jgi:hypothetical protein